MLKRLLPLTIIAAGMLTSCASDDAVNSGDDPSKYEGVVAEVSPMEDATEGTRSSLTFDPTAGMVFKWNDPLPEENADRLTIFPESGSASGIYTLSAMLEDNKTLARFTATGFSLSEGMRYYALSKKEDKGKHPNWNFPSAGNITVDYSGQRQTASGDYETAHLGEYDFMAATALCESENTAYFPFKHLGATLRMVLKGLPGNVEFTKLEIYDSENTFRQPIRTIDLKKGLDGEGNYNPAYDALDESSDAYKQAPLFALDLGFDENNGITPTDDDGTGSTKKMVAYILLPPFNFVGKDVVFHLYSKDGNNDYYGKCIGKNLLAGKAYQMNVPMESASTYKVNVKVAYNWQLGNALTRATGDPGKDDGFEAPKFIYAFFCGDNVVQGYQRIAVGTSNDVNDAWTDPDQNNVITYKTPLTFSVASLTDKSSARVYIVASKTELTIPTIKTTTPDQTTEATVKSITYSIQDVAESPNINTALDASQQFLRDLYSTPWQSNETFVGKLISPYQDIILYHTAAKVDLLWNSAAALSGSVSVNSVKNEGLSLFKPTTNTWVAGSYTVSTSLTEETKWNGRQVYYLPQFANSAEPASACKYDVTVGEHTHTGVSMVTFSPATTNGFTSWLRWQKTY